LDFSPRAKKIVLYFGCGSKESQLRQKEELFGWRKIWLKRLKRQFLD
jgi:hypothetical protein